MNYFPKDTPVLVDALYQHERCVKIGSLCLDVSTTIYARKQLLDDLHRMRTYIESVGCTCVHHKNGLWSHCNRCIALDVIPKEEPKPDIVILPMSARFKLPKPCPVCNARMIAAMLTGKPDDNSDYHASELSYFCTAEPDHNDEAQDERWDSWWALHYRDFNAHELHKYEEEMLAWVKERYKFRKRRDIPGL